jgi:rhodanese-related sulfurtransferase
MTATITTKELKQLIDSNNTPILIDVRNENELQYGKITNKSVLIPLPKLQTRISELEKFKNQKIIVYCRSGGRSKVATDFLTEQGFKQVMNLIGGILAWREFDNSIIPY